LRAFLWVDIFRSPLRTSMRRSRMISEVSMVCGRSGWLYVLVVLVLRSYTLLYLDRATRSTSSSWQAAHESCYWHMR